ncbi:hypothetical protein D3C75_513090 [compost metagenome]
MNQLYTCLSELINVDLVDCIEKAGMKLELHFRIHKESNEEAYKKLIERIGTITIKQDNDQFPLIYLEFKSYIGDSILNESYTIWDDYEAFEGKIFRVFKRSRYLDFIQAGTIATTEHPGPFKHYGIAALNHIVDIVSTDEPQIYI